MAFCTQHLFVSLSPTYGYTEVGRALKVPWDLEQVAEASLATRGPQSLNQLSFRLMNSVLPLPQDQQGCI